MPQVVEFVPQSILHVAEFTGRDAMFAGNGLHGVQPFLDPVPPGRIGVQRVDVAMQLVGGLRELYAGFLEERQRRGERLVVLAEFLQRLAGPGHQRLGRLTIAVVGVVEYARQTLRQTPDVLELLALGNKFLELIGLQVEGVQFVDLEFEQIQS